MGLKGRCIWWGGMMWRVAEVNLKTSSTQTFQNATPQSHIPEVPPEQVVGTDSLAGDSSRNAPCSAGRVSCECRRHDLNNCLSSPVRAPSARRHRLTHSANTLMSRLMECFYRNTRVSSTHLLTNERWNAFTEIRRSAALTF